MSLPWRRYREMKSPLLNLDLRNLHVRPLFVNPLLQPLHQVPGARSVARDSDKGYDRSRRDVLEIDLCGGDVEGIARASEEPLEDSPLPFQRVAGEMEEETDGVDEHRLKLGVPRGPREGNDVANVL